MGTSHSEMLDQIRIKIACRMLVDPSKRLSDIANFLGYANPSSFSRAFARLMKIQPIIYRQHMLAQRRKRPHKSVALSD